MTHRTDHGPITLPGRRVLITGSSGFVGSHIAARFVREGAEVAGLSRTLGRLAGLAQTGTCAFLACDLENAEQCRTVVRAFAPEVVVHFASRPDAAESVEHARASVGANVSATVNLLEACTPTVRAFVYGDSCKVHGTAEPPYTERTPLEPNSSYAATKAAGWWMCRAFAEVGNFAAVSLRPTLIYGPGQGMNLIEYVARRALSGADEIVLDGGTQTRDPLYIDDAIDACVKLVSRAPDIAGHAIPVGGGSEISVGDLSMRVVAACASHAKVRACPERARATEIWRSWCDNSDAARLIGWHPTVSLNEGLSRTVASIRARLGSDSVNG